MEPEALTGIVRHVMRLLVERRFKELDEASKGVRLSAAAMQKAISGSQGLLVMPPERGWNDLDVIAIRNRLGAFSVRMDLWTAQGRSNLSVEMTLYSKDGRPIIEVDDIHVL